ncbi:putative disease resistance protein, partial [Trifolium medium]|nr:putative disease resistance protein [Trifolium medium]
SLGLDARSIIRDEGVEDEFHIDELQHQAIGAELGGSLNENEDDQQQLLIPPKKRRRT